MKNMSSAAPLSESKFHSLLRRLTSSQELAVLIALAAVTLFFALAAPFFLSELTLRQNTRQIAMIAMIATGMTFVIASGEIDISVGSIYNLAATVMALLIANHGFDPWAAAFVALVVGALAGMGNGVLAVVLRLPTLIVTLGTVSIYRGLTILLSGGLSIGNFPNHDFYVLGTRGIGFIPIVVVIALIIIIVASLVFQRTIFARELLAIGSSTPAARRTGIRNGRRKVQVMALNGFFCGLAAVIGISFLRSASPQSGVGFELLAIASVVVGGTPLQGGVGTIFGTLIGATLITVIQSGLIQLGLPAVWQITATGAMILGAVAIQQIVRRRAVA